MSFEEDAMDKASKSLEVTKTFCTSHQQKKFTFFSSSPAPQDRLTPHERIMRRCIVADCMLFEAILVFLKQGITSYVKGGYLLRKAWKTYEKVYEEMETLCSCPSPISKSGTLSPTDRHVGTSIYDRKIDDGEVKDEDIAASARDVSETLQLGFASLGIGGEETCPVEGEVEVCRDASQLSSGEAGQGSVEAANSSTEQKPTAQVDWCYKDITMHEISVSFQCKKA